MARKKFLEFGIRQRLFQGAGCIEQLTSILENEGWKRAMLVVDPFLYKAGLITPIEELIKSAGTEYIVFSNVRPNPEVETIEKEAVPAFKEFGAEVVIAIGGGSTMDTAKGVVLVGDSDHKVMDFTIDKIKHDEKFSHKMPSMIAIPTTAGTGSDVCINAVICDETGLKLVPSHDSILPQYALMDPDLLAGMPFSVAAATSVDAFVHALETLTNRNANDFTRTFSLRSLELVGESIRPFVSDPSNPVYADKMSLACMYAGFSLGLASIGQDHVITHPMSEEPFHMPHGDACGMALPPVIEWNGLACKDLYRQAYNALTKENLDDTEFEVDMLIDWVLQLNADLHIAKDMTFEEWGYNDNEVLELMLEHPILKFAMQVNGPTGQTEYPRTTNRDDFAYIIKRMNIYSKVQAEYAKSKMREI